MLFNSYIFILLFLPLSLIGYFTINKFEKYQIANIFLIGMSLWFYGYFNPKYLIIIISSVVINYTLSKLIITSSGVISRTFLSIGILINVASIFYFKYFDFFIANVNNIFRTSFELKNIVLPLGISFFTFQQISYLVDSYHGKTSDYTFIEYALFVVYFPQLIAGPIVLHNETIPQFNNTKNRQLNYDNLAHGLFIFSLGLGKKVLIADILSPAVSWAFSSVSELTTAEAFLASILYTLQLYFDFSGYCDMAIGIGKMFNIDLPHNFNSPYKALSIDDFWSRWHMSLTRFLRQYVYFPLGGSKKGIVRTYINIMIVFLVSGIWHGANWTFIVWGILHGIFNCLSKLFAKPWAKLPKLLQCFVTFNIVNILWIIFRSQDLIYARAFIGKFVHLNGFTLSKSFTDTLITPEIEFLITKFTSVEQLFTAIPYLIMLFTVFILLLIVTLTKNTLEIKFNYSRLQSAITVFLLVWSIMSLTGVSEFLYFDF